MEIRGYDIQSGDVMDVETRADQVVSPLCEEALRLVNKMWDRPLSEEEAVQCFGHLENCEHCSKIFTRLQELEMAEMMGKRENSECGFTTAGRRN